MDCVLLLGGVAGAANALLKAAAEGDTKIVQTLVHFGVNPNSADIAGCTALHIAAIHDKPAVVWALVLECVVNPASLNSDGKKARDLTPPGSIAYKTLEWLEEVPDPKYAKANTENRADGFLCPLCRETSGDGIALVPCGHRVCRRCWKNSTNAPLAERRSSTARRRTRGPTGTRCTRTTCVEVGGRRKRSFSVGV